MLLHGHIPFGATVINQETTLYYNIYIYGYWTPQELINTASV